MESCHYHKMNSTFFCSYTMALSTVIFVAALLINTQCYCSADKLYCVTPTATSCSSCPLNSTNCTTLSTYAKEAELYFASNTTMIFLPGDHILNKNITVRNVARLIMRGESSFGMIVKVICSGSVGFSFTNMVDFGIHSLAFTHCSRSKYGLFIQSTQYAELVNCSFNDNFGTALVIINANITLAGNSEFTNNHCGSTSCGGGGGIVAISSNLTFTGYTIFLENIVTPYWGGGGGGITAVSSNLTFTGNITFLENIATFYQRDYGGGGAIYAYGNSMLIFNGTNNFINNSANYGTGGAIYSAGSTILSFSGTNHFFNNSADSVGGAIYTEGSTVLSFSGTNNFFKNSPDSNGGAIYAYGNSMLIFNGTNNFINNSATRGGAIYTLGNTVLNFSGTNNFFNNSADSNGGAICAYWNAVVNFDGTNNFFSNSADDNDGEGGAIYAYGSAVLSFYETNNFFNNTADHGGAIYAFGSTVLRFSATSSFFNNSANHCGEGGAIYSTNSAELIFSGTSNFFNNTADNNGSAGNCGGGAIYAYFMTELSFSGTNNFFNNSANHGGDGGAIHTSHFARLIFSGTSNFINNSADDNDGRGGAIYADSNAILWFSETNNFTSNSAIDGGAIHGNTRSTLRFDGTTYFTNNGYFGGRVDTLNGGTNGGGVFLQLKSTLDFLSNTTVYWEDNHASLGGAIYVDDRFYDPFAYCNTPGVTYPPGPCFFSVPLQNSLPINIQLVFKDNTADAGSVLYGGAIDNCRLPRSSGKVFDMIVHIESQNTTSSISSEPFRVCPCENNYPNCSESRILYTVYPGETFNVSVVAVGQRNGIVTAGIRSTVDRGHLLGSQYYQQASNTCTTINYTVFTLDGVHLELYADGPCSTFSYILNLNLTVNQTCPPGFNISESAMACICEPRLERYTDNCNITNGVGQITRNSDKQFWVGYDNQSLELILHPLCPFDYCISQTVVFTLNNTDMQCAYNRSDLLCGHCKKGYSLVLGTSQCRKCTNSHLALIIPFALLGVALVFLLLACKLTVATGTLSGLVFYANIIGPNRTIFLPVKSTDVFSIFIAWLNLDFGIETCFYDGMDAYTKTWLQFVFPVYIWLLVGLIILVSRFSRRFAKLLGDSPVAVLATLILLSYTKILRTLIAVIYITHLEYPTYKRSVWLYDANIDYLSGKHIPLFLVAVLVFLFLFLPYTLLLLFGQWLQAKSDLKLFSWVNKLKPLMDSYHAYYKPKHRYWTGLLLVLRVVLLLVFALNPQQDPSINLLAIQVGTGILVVWAWVSGGVHEKWYLDALESSFALNLIILAATTYYINFSSGNELAAGYTSVSIAFTTFIIILAYCIFQQLKNTNLNFYKFCIKHAENKPADNQAENKPADNQAENKPTDNPLVQVADFSQLREPLLEDTPPT